MKKATAVIHLIKSEMNYVNKVADGDKSIILLSGFDCNEEPVPTTYREKR
jgi:hypothetical protein